MDKKFVDPAVLKDGRILVELKKRFIENRKPETLYPLLGCLKDSVLILPFTPTDDEHIRPDILAVPNGDCYLPIFSQNEQIPDDYKKKFAFMPIPMEQCIKIANEINGLKGLVLDPYTDGMYVTFDMADLILEMESKLKN